MEALCRLCQNDEAWHQRPDVRHLFVHPDGADGALRASKPPSEALQAAASAMKFSPTQNSAAQVLSEAPTITYVGPPHDLALRLALIQAGVIGAEQLAEAEAQLRAINGGGVIHATPADRTVAGANGYAVPAKRPSERRAKKKEPRALKDVRG